MTRARAARGAALTSAIAIAILSVGLAACGAGKVPDPPIPSTAPVAASGPAVDAAAAPGEGSAAAPAPRAGADAGGREDRLIARMLKRVVARRGVDVPKPVPGVVLTRDELIARVRSHVGTEVPHEALRNEGLALQLLGFVPTKFDYEASTFALLEAQLAGFYEPETGTMYLAADLEDELADATLAHELVHALQDQKWGLREQTKYKPGQSDKSAAIHALAEGDATSAMADVLMAEAKKGKTALDLPDDLLAEGMLASVAQGLAAGTPHVMQTSLVSPYVEGTRFVHTLRRMGGWAAVNEAWARPPSTTEQLLHEAKWRANEPALAVEAPTLAPLGAAWKSIDADTFGELGLRLAFAEWAGLDEAVVAAGKWGGDRVVLAENAGTFALALHVRYDAAPPGGEPHASAQQAFGIVSRALLGKFAGASKASAARGALFEAGAFMCVERPQLGPLALLRKDSELVLIAGPTKTSDTKPWAAAGNCTAARTWARAIAEQR